MTDLIELLELAKTGYFDKLESNKSVAVIDCNIQCEQPNNVTHEKKIEKKPVQRNANGKRKYLMDYIPPNKNGKNPLFAAVKDALKLMKEGQSPAYANGWAAKKYRVSKHDVAHYTGQVAGTVRGRRT